MSILTQVAGLILTVYLLVIWCLHKRLDASTESIFLASCIAAINSQVFDILTQVFYSNYFVVSDFWKKFVIDWYLISILICLLCISLYANKIIFNNKLFNRVKIILISFVTVSSLITIVLKADVIYTPIACVPVGPAVTYSYIINCLFSLVSLIQIIYFRKKISNWAFISSVAWIICLMAAGIAQFIFFNTTGIPVVSFGIAIGILVIYLIIENPGNKFDYDDNIFHSESFIGYIKESIENHDMVSVLLINVVSRDIENQFRVKYIYSDLVKAFEKKTSAKFFKGYSDELIISSKYYDDLKMIASSLPNCINEVEQNSSHVVRLKASVTLVPSIEKVTSYQLLRNVFDDYRVKAEMVSDEIEINTITDDICEEYNKEMKIIEHIDNAIKNDDFIIDFQPLENIKDKGKVNAEAIVKIKTQDEGILVPSDYYSTAEDFDKFIQIDAASLKHVCKTICAINKGPNSLGFVFVRMSVQALENVNYYDEFVKTIEEYNISPSQICLEVTNADSILKKEVLLDNVNKLKEFGVVLAIGGFGSGESNLNYFIDLPMHIIKFDQSVLNNAMKDPKAAVVMKDITNLAHSLDFKVVVVGVENAKQKEFVLDCGVEMLLGDFISPIKNEEEFINSVNKTIEGRSF